MKIISRPSRSLAAEKSFYNETRRQVTAILNDKTFTHDNVVGGINWGSAVIRTQTISKCIFDTPTMGAIYTIYSTRENPKEKKVFKNYEIEYKEFSIEHLSGYRNSDPTKFISELWLNINAIPTAPDAGILALVGSREHCMLNRSRLRYNDGAGNKGMLFQLSPYGSPQLYSVDSKKEYENILMHIEEISNLFSKLVKTDEAVFIETNSVLSEPVFQ